MTADSKPVKQEVKSTVILPPLVFPGLRISSGKSKVNKIKHKYFFSSFSGGKVEGHLIEKQVKFLFLS